MCGMLLLIHALDTCLWHQSPHIIQIHITWILIRHTYKMYCNTICNVMALVIQWNVDLGAIYGWIHRQINQYGFLLLFTLHCTVCMNNTVVNWCIWSTQCVLVVVRSIFITFLLEDPCSELIRSISVHLVHVFFHAAEVSKRNFIPNRIVNVANYPCRDKVNQC